MFGIFKKKARKAVTEVKKMETLPDSAEKSAGLRKLLEAKDALVRAKLG